MQQGILAYNLETLAHFRQKVEGALEGIRLRVEHNHNNEPKFLEDLKGWEPGDGVGGTELLKHIVLSSRDEEQKKDLENALVRLNRGTYGFCEYPGCGKVIPFDRLESIPQARYDLDHEVEVRARKIKDVAIPKKRRKTRY